VHELRASTSALTVAWQSLHHAFAGMDLAMAAQACGKGWVSAWVLTPRLLWLLCYRGAHGSDKMLTGSRSQTLFDREVRQQGPVAPAA